MLKGRSRLVVGRMSAVAQALILLPLCLDANAGGDAVVRVEGASPTPAWAGGELAASPFLTAARQGILPVLEKLGTGMYAVRVDIAGNIDRLESAVKEHGSDGGLLYNVVRREMNANAHADSRSSTKALLWLKRALQFMSAMLRLVVREDPLEVSVAASQVYEQTLKRYHGFLTRTAFSAALNFVPTRAAFIEQAGDGQAAEETIAQLRELVAALDPVLEHVHGFLDAHGLDDPAVV